MTAEEARAIRAMVAMVEDALRAATSIAERAAGLLNGSDGTNEFHALASAIASLHQSPEMGAVKSASAPRSDKEG